MEIIKNARCIYVLSVPFMIINSLLFLLFEMYNLCLILLRSFFFMSVVGCFLFEDEIMLKIALNVFFCFLFIIFGCTARAKGQLYFVSCYYSLSYLFCEVKNCLDHKLEKKKSADCFSVLVRNLP